MMEISINEEEIRKEKKMIALEMPKDLYDEIRLCAFKDSVSVSAEIRKMISQYLDIINAQHINEREI